MSRKFHKIRRLYGPSLLIKPARCASGDMNPIAGPSAEQAEKEFADENWRDDSGAAQARQPKRRHIGAVSAIIGATLDAATTLAARVRLITEACGGDTRNIRRHELHEASLVLAAKETLRWINAGRNYSSVRPKFAGAALRARFKARAR